MHQVVWLLKWLLKVAIFFTLFAFALNNKHDVTVRFFFGHQWTTSLVLVVLSAFAVGLAIGIFGMVPRWWQQRKHAVAGRKAAANVASGQEKSPLAPPDGL